MTWVRRHPMPIPATPHECEPPETQAPPEGTSPHVSWLFLVPAAGDGSLWRCDCGRLYRVGRIVADGGLRWLPARWWQRWHYRKGSP